MSAIFGEVLTFPQENGPNVKLKVFGDEFYARYENEEGYSVIYDKVLGLYCYATLVNGAFISSGIPIDNKPPFGIEKHIKESDETRKAVMERSAGKKGLLGSRNTRGDREKMF